MGHMDRTDPRRITAICEAAGLRLILTVESAPDSSPTTIDCPSEEADPVPASEPRPGLVRAVRPELRLLSSRRSA